MLERSWLGLCAGGARECLTPSHWGAKLAPQLTPRQSAEIYTVRGRAALRGRGGGGEGGQPAICPGNESPPDELVCDWLLMLPADPLPRRLQGLCLHGLAGGGTALS